MSFPIRYLRVVNIGRDGLSDTALSRDDCAVLAIADEFRRRWLRTMMNGAFHFRQ